MVGSLGLHAVGDALAAQRPFPMIDNALAQTVPQISSKKANNVEAVGIQSDWNNGLTWRREVACRWSGDYQDSVQAVSKRARYCLLSALLATSQSCAEPQAAPPAAASSAASTKAAAPTAASASAGETASTSRSAAASATKSGLARLAFVGDVALSLNVGTVIERITKGESLPPGVAEGFPFAAVVERLRAADMLIGNLECVVSERGSIATDHNPFRCPLATVGVLKRAGFDLMSVANNHALDFGRSALRDMLRNLDRGGMAHFGVESLANAPQLPIIRRFGKIRVGFLAYYWPPKKPIRDIERARPQVDILVIFPHWGREDEAEPLLMQRKLARDFIDAGADLVVGTHAHVMQPNEWYKGKLIAHGLGNFVFDGMTHTEAHRTGGILEVDIGVSGILSARMLKVRLDKYGAPHFVKAPASVPPLVEKPEVGATTRLTPPPPGTAYKRSGAPSTTR